MKKILPVWGEGNQASARAAYQNGTRVEGSYSQHLWDSQLEAVSVVGTNGERAAWAEAQNRRAV